MSLRCSTSERDRPAASRGSSPLRRRAFTIPELLVAMALILFIMAILSEAFVAGLDSFRQLKAIGDMQEKFRATTIQLRYDLASYHFYYAGVNNPTLHLSDPTILTAGPQAGFFRISQGSLPPTPGNLTYTLEGSDPAPSPLGVNSYRAVDHILHFTAYRPGGPPEGFFSAQVPAGQPPTFPLDGTSAVPPGLPPSTGPMEYQQPGIVNSQWVEVAYFLRPTGNSAGSTPLYALYRRQCAVLTESDATTVNAPPKQVLIANTPWSLWPEMSCRPDATNTFLQFNAMPNLVTPPARCLWNQALAPPSPPPQVFQGTANPQNAYLILGENGEPATRIGDDLLLTDVISFQVQVLRQWSTGKDFQFHDLNDPGPPGGGGNVFDTAVQPIPYQILMLQITIRVWDVKTQQTRQITVVQDM
jgi:prepilin-type N-terminal cleavage/methylation domain-containing protein